MDKPIRNADEAIRWAASRFAACGIDTPLLDAELVLAAATGMTRTEVHLHHNVSLTEETIRVFGEMVQRRCQREPLAYILGKRAFWDIELEVTPDVLVPRPETELLVEQALCWLNARDAGAIWAADIGTGSGAIAVSLAHALPALRCLAVDRSLAALQVAWRNVQHYHLENRVHLVCSDLLSCTTARFDLVAANLPYVPSFRLDTLEPEVTQYEPRLALDGGESGLDVIDCLCRTLPQHVQPSALVLVEIDEGQGDQVCDLIRAALPRAELTVLRDYGGWERLIKAEIKP